MQQSKSNSEFEQELIRSKLTFLPEIQHEIRSLLELVPGKDISRRFQKALSYIQGLPDIQQILNESDNEKLYSIFQEFEIAKSVTRVEILAIRTNLELGLSDWRIGKHAIRNASSLKISEFMVTQLWAANIIPSTHAPNFQMPARITLAHDGSRYRIAFGLGTSIDNVSTSVIQIELSKNWIDPLAKSLRQLDFFQVQGDKQISLSGIVYELDMLSWAGKSSIEFTNPDINANKSFLELEKALFSIAEIVVSEKGQQSAKDYLSIWQKYIIA